MPRKARQKCESGYYHIILRGIGRQILFEVDKDRERFLATLRRCRGELGFEVIAWCLMENHVHLLLHDLHGQMDLIMKKLAVSYAQYFNRKYDRSGHLFQDRYMSEPVTDDAYLLTVVRYIHRNPEKAGIANAADYPWSSYGAYLSPGQDIDNAIILEMLGGSGGFETFMTQMPDESCMDIQSKRWIHDDAAWKWICKTYNLTSGTQLQQLERKDRDTALREMRKRGLSVRQIERLTGISRGIIQRIKM